MEDRGWRADKQKNEQTKRIERDQNEIDKKGKERSKRPPTTEQRTAQFLRVRFVLLSFFLFVRARPVVALVQNGSLWWGFGGVGLLGLFVFRRNA